MRVSEGVSTPLRVKVCGMRDRGNVEAVLRLSPDYMGFIFYPKSPRCCDGLDPETVAMVRETGVEPVAVTVDMDEAEIMSLVERYGFRTLQLHGGESPELCLSLRMKGLGVIKAFGIRGEESLEGLNEYAGAVDIFLLDTACAEKGGSGRKFDWRALEGYDLDVPFMLSGGIGPEDGAAIRNITHPRFLGIDLNSRFETSPGIKDPELLKKFLMNLNER